MASTHAPGRPFPLPCNPARRSRRLSISACATSAMRCPTAACCWKTPATISAWRATAHRPQRRGQDAAAATAARRTACAIRPHRASRTLRRRAAVPPPAGVTLADVAGMTPALRALARIEAGTGSQADFDLMDGRWRVREEWPRMLADAGLPAWPPERPASAVSGGELTRVALAGALAQHRRTAAGRAHQSSGRPRPGLADGQADHLARRPDRRQP